MVRDNHPWCKAHTTERDHLACQDVREPEVREAFRRLHAAYVDAVCNPFQAAEEPLLSNAFGAAVDAVARQLRPAPGRQ